MLVYIQRIQHSFLASGCHETLAIFVTIVTMKTCVVKLWGNYSMLKRLLIIKHNVNIKNYSQLIAFLKQNAEGYQSKQANVFTGDEVNRFISEAPDDQFLAVKVKQQRIYFVLLILFNTFTKNKLFYSGRFDFWCDWNVSRRRTDKF